MVCGDPVTLPARLTLALAAPADTGLKVTDSVQLAFTASVVPQVFVNPKSAAKLPASPMDLKVTLAVPLLVTVTVLTAEVLPTVSLLKASDFELSVNAGAAAVILTSTALEVDAP